MIYILHTINRSPIFKLLINNAVKKHNFFRLYYSASDHNIKRFRLVKRLASTLLFGGTFLAVLFSRKYKRLDVFDDAKLLPLNANYHKNFKLYEHKGFILPLFVMKNVDDIKNFSCREDDLFVVSFPKTGTTWLQEIIYCIVKGIDQSSERSIEDRFPYLEFVYPGISSIQKNSEQRFIKTHLPYSLLPKDIELKKPKIFYIMRNPKDVAVSYYHFIRMMTITDYSGSFQSFFQDFINDKVPYGPMWKHYTDIWEHREDSNILILSYEDFHKDLHGNIRKIALFLGKYLTDKEVKEIADHCSFNNMAANPNVNYQHWDDLGLRKQNESRFMRKGHVGDWKNYFDLDMNKAMNLWIEEHFSELEFSFCYELDI